MKRSLLLILIVVYTTGLLAQATKPSKKKLPSSSVSTYTGGVTDTCLNKKFSIVFYIFQDSATLRTTTTPSIVAWVAAMMQKLNREFSKICVEFVNCSTVVVPHWQMNQYVHQATSQALIASWYTENVINVYLPNHCDPWGVENGGLAYAMNTTGAFSSTRTAVVISTDSFLPDNYIEPVHIFGHFFGLNETWLDINPANPPSPANPALSQEYVDGSNCATHGDGICDTEADCWPNQYIPPIAQDWSLYRYNCDYQRDYKDGKGFYYTPPFDNFMGAWPCRCRFTQEQFAKMVRYILKYRWHLH